MSRIHDIGTHRTHVFFSIWFYYYVHNNVIYLFMCTVVLSYLWKCLNCAYWLYRVVIYLYDDLLLLTTSNYTRVTLLQSLFSYLHKVKWRIILLCFIMCAGRLSLPPPATEACLTKPSYTRQTKLNNHHFSFCRKPKTNVVSTHWHDYANLGHTLY